MVSLLLPSLITCGGGGGEGWIEGGWGGEKEGGGGKGEERMDVCMEGEGEGKGGRERRREGMDGWREGEREQEGGREGRGRRGWTSMHARMHTCTHTHMHACTHAHTHLLQFSIRDLWSGKNQLAPFLGIIGPAERGTHFHLTPHQTCRLHVHMYTLYSTYVQYVHNV